MRRIVADLVIKNGKVITVNGEDVFAEAVAVLNDIILWVGANEEIESLQESIHDTTYTHLGIDPNLEIIFSVNYYYNPLISFFAILDGGLKVVTNGGPFPL